MCSLKLEIEEIKGDPHLHTLNTVEDIRDLPLLKMRQIHRKLNSDLEKLNQVSRTQVFILFILIYFGHILMFVYVCHIVCCIYFIFL